jgi:DNA polymerase gamma 1
MNPNQDLNPIIHSAPPEIHKKLLGVDPKPSTQKVIRACRNHLETIGLEIVDTSSFIDLPIPNLSAPLPEWLVSECKDLFSDYFELIDKATFTRNPKDQNTLTESVESGEDLQEKSKTVYFIPGASPFNGWSKYDNKKSDWVSLEIPDTELLFFDFEARLQLDGKKYLPIMCAGMSLDGTWYSWIADDFANLPTVIDFGETFTLGIGHNAVQYDRRHIKQCYEYNHKVRILDTLSLYFNVMGLAGDQYKSYQKAKAIGYRPEWFKHTSEGNLKALTEYFVGDTLDKEIRDELQTKSLEYLREHIDYFWKYCAKDTRYTVEVFKGLMADFKRMSPHPISLAGMLERSTLRIGIVEDYSERLKTVDASIKNVSVTINKVLESLLEKHGLEYEPLQARFQIWQELDQIDRYLASKKNHEGLIDKLDLPFKVTKAGKKISLPVGERRDIVRDLVSKGEIKLPTPNGFEKWKAAIHKKADKEKLDIQPDSFISLAGKTAPYVLQLHWLKRPLHYNGFTWGIFQEDNNPDSWLSLPHPKNEENVGTPLSKDFKAKVTVGEFTSPVCDLNLVYEAISTVSVWISFRERFQNLYLYNDTWLTDILPVGTITERATGLCVVLPNTTKGRAGTECKHWFKISNPDHIKVSADYASQESIIFAAHADTVNGELGSCAASVQVLAGNSDLGTDAHTTTAKLLAQYCDSTPKELRQLAKSMNFANQFMCGVKKLASMIFLALKGVKNMDECMEIATSFINSSRGNQDYGKYSGGLGSNGFNRLKELTRQPIQKSQILKREIPKPLQERYCGRDFMTTRFNYNIQQTGQELVNICLVTVGILAKKFNIPYNLAFLVHDEIHIECHKDNQYDMAWMMQIGHLFSKVMLYYSFNINTFPQNGMWFESVELDHTLRKSPKDEGITPSKSEATSPGFALGAERCKPTSPHILALLEEMGIDSNLVI